MVVWNSMLLNWNEVEIRDAKINNRLLDVVKQHVRFIIPDNSRQKYILFNKKKDAESNFRHPFSI